MSQTAFRAALFDPDLPVPPGLTDPQGRPAGRRFNVYRNNVSASLTEALRTAFPVIRALVGDDFFTAMATIYLRAHPPRSPLLMFYGSEMADFLSTFAPVAHLRYLPDIARLELALRHSYHAADIAPVSPETLAELPPDQLMNTQLKLAPTVFLIRSRWPVHAIWMANTRNGPSPKAGPQDVLVVRPEFDPEPALLPSGAGDFIEKLIAGDTIAAALDEEIDFDLTATLGLLITSGAITETISEAAQ
ncbi:MAG: DNA-binding domain-containing protein [Albidovulum sp.]